MLPQVRVDPANPGVKTKPVASGDGCRALCVALRVAWRRATGQDRVDQDARVRPLEQHRHHLAGRGGEARGACWMLSTARQHDAPTLAGVNRAFSRGPRGRARAPP
eukprot:4513441-Prymnesium_polylepis.1